MTWPIQEQMAELEIIQFLYLANSLVGLQVVGPGSSIAPRYASEIWLDDAGLYRIWGTLAG